MFVPYLYAPEGLRLTKQQYVAPERTFNRASHPDELRALCGQFGAETVSEFVFREVLKREERREECRKEIHSANPERLTVEAFGCVGTLGATEERARWLAWQPNATAAPAPAWPFTRSFSELSQWRCRKDIGQSVCEPCHRESRRSLQQLDERLGKPLGGQQLIKMDYQPVEFFFREAFWKTIETHWVWGSAGIHRDRRN
jgi:hypothetical protein